MSVTQVCPTVKHVTRLFNSVVNSAACKRSAYRIRAKSILQIKGKIKCLEGKQELAVKLAK